MAEQHYFKDRVPAPKKWVCEYSGHRVTITEAEPLPFVVAAFNLSRFGAKEEMARFFLHEVELWVKTPTIEDGFQDHNERIAWRKNLNPPELEFVIQENKLSGSRVAAAIAALQSTITLLRAIHDPLAPQLAQDYKMLADIVTSLNSTQQHTPSEYLGTIHRVDSIARKILALFN